MIYTYIQSDNCCTENYNELQLYSIIIESISIFDEQLENMLFYEDTYITESSRKEYIDLLKDSKAKIYKIKDQVIIAKNNKDKDKYIKAVSDLTDAIHDAKSKIKTIKPTKVETTVAIITAFLKSISVLLASIAVGIGVGTINPTAATPIAAVGGAIAGHGTANIIPTYDTTDLRKNKELTKEEKYAKWNPYRNAVLNWLDTQEKFCNKEIQYVKSNW